MQHLSIFLSPARSRVVTDIAAGAADSLATGFVVHDVPRSTRA